MQSRTVRRLRPALLLAPTLLFAASDLRAQHLPIRGCRAAASCAGPRGFKAHLDAAGEGNALFSLGVSYSGGFSLRLVRPSRPEGPDYRAVEAAVALFLARHPWRGRTPSEDPPGTKPRNPERSRP